MSFTKSPPWRNPVAIGISSPSGRGDTAPDNPLDNPLEYLLSLRTQPLCDKTNKSYIRSMIEVCVGPLTDFQYFVAVDGR